MQTKHPIRSMQSGAAASRTTPEQAELWQRIEAFAFDDPSASFTFSRRLAREQKWTLSHARRVLREYQKFAFLTVAAGHPCAPSDAVDQAWHLHLIYTRSYWEDFCGKVLKTPLHHGPTRGGGRELEKHVDWYQKTLESYRRFFGEPPADLWPAARERFDANTRWTRVDLAKHWLIPKPKLGRAFAAIAAVGAAVLAGCTPFLAAADAKGNPFDLDGPAFLGVLVATSIVGVIVAVLFRGALAFPKDLPEPGFAEEHPYETAFHMGGLRRAVEAAMAKLHHTGAIRYDAEQKKLVVQQVPPADAHPLETKIVDGLQQEGQPGLSDADRKSLVTQFQDRLRELGLWVPKDQTWLGRYTSAAIMAALFAFAGTKLWVGLERGKPVGFLVVMMLVLGLIGLAMFFIETDRSGRGKKFAATLDRAKKEYEELPPTASPAQIALGVAALGLGAYAIGSLAPLNDWRSEQALREKTLGAGTTNWFGGNSSSSGDGGGSGCSSGDSGGGDGGGGGCGGCGGGGD